MFEVAKGQYIPVHPDAMDLIPKNNVFKLTSSAKYIMLRHCPDADGNPNGVAKRVKSKVMNIIMARLSPDMRQA